MHLQEIVIVVIISTVIRQSSGSYSDVGYCDGEVMDCEETKTRFLFYDVNPPEGFNLRRDVYMRYAVFAHALAKTSDEDLNSFKLVLPPWSNLYHWKRREEPEQIPWGLFFDVDSLRKFAPVVEMYEFFNQTSVTYGKINIDEVYVLQHYQDMFDTGKFEDKMSIEECNAETSTSYFYYHNLTSKNVRCLSFHGFTGQLVKVLAESSAKSILFDHGEVALHDRFGDKTYWECRRSMRFNKELVEIANDYRKKFLNSTNEDDLTVLPEDYREEKARRSALGGPYLAVHLRRRDFVWARPKHVPSIKSTGKQIREKLKELNLNTVFVATDASQKEIDELKLLLNYEVHFFKYKPNTAIKKKYKEGGVAIIEQIICAHARYFMGTYESTFSFRIQEEREILGFPPETTFNRLCGTEEKECEGTTRWLIEY